MARIGYARVSSTDQDHATQVARLRGEGCKVVHSEKVTGSTRQGRSELASIIESLGQVGYREAIKAELIMEGA